MGYKAFSWSMLCKNSHLDVSEQRMWSERKYSKHDELLISEPSGDANNLLLIHQGHHLSARQHCNAGRTITKFIIWQSTEEIHYGTTAHFLVFKVIAIFTLTGEGFETVLLLRSSLSHNSCLIWSHVLGQHWSILLYWNKSVSMINIQIDQKL